MNYNTLKNTLLAFCITLATIGLVHAKEVLPKVIYPGIRQNPSPDKGMNANLNPEVLQWPGSNVKGAKYKAELSQDPEFQKNVIRSKEQSSCFFNPHRKLESGTWYWRYQTSNAKEPQWSQTHSFVINDDTPLFVTPHIDEIVEKLPKKHPYMLNQGRDVNELREEIKKYPTLLAKIKDANKNVEKTNLRELSKAFLVTGDKQYVDMARQKTKEFLGDPKNLNMNIFTEAIKMREFCEAYDTFFDEFDESLKKEMLDRTKIYLDKNLSWWSGNRENVYLENHFWQTYVSGVFISALATINELPESKGAMEYTYGIFLARAPVAGGRDGGWANGLAYFTVNYMTIVNMGHYLYSLCNVDIYNKPWFKNLPDYYLLCGGVFAPMDGFGNMHDRVYTYYKQNGKSWNFGYPVCENIALANDNQLAKLQVNQDWNGVTFEQFVAGKNLKMTELEKSKVKVPQSRQFRDVGVTAMHTDVLNPRKDMALYFRSSPFGSLGHMHANQNVFNIAYKGERVFYSSGYYTEFMDRHTLTSYRHTRAHNGILIDGKGQSMDTGYGWLKRYASGDKVSYVCGDATTAYVENTNKSWFNEKLLNPNEAKENFGDAKLNTFNRHMIFLRPDIVLVYDELDSEEPHIWSWLLHTYKQPELTSTGILNYTALPGIAARATLFASEPVNAEISDQFYIDPKDKNPRYKNAANQYHISWNSKEKSKAIRFLSVIQCASKEQELIKVEQTGANSFKIGEYNVTVELNPAKPAVLSVKGKDCGIFINDIPEEFLGVKCQRPATGKPATLVMELQNNKVTQQLTEDAPPSVAYVF